MKKKKTIEAKRLKLHASMNEGKNKICLIFWYYSNELDYTLKFSTILYHLKIFNNSKSKILNNIIIIFILLLEHDLRIQASPKRQVLQHCKYNFLVICQFFLQSQKYLDNCIFYKYVCLQLKI